MEAEHDKIVLVPCGVYILKGGGTVIKYLRRDLKYNMDKRDDKELSSDCLARDYRIEEKFEL